VLLYGIANLLVQNHWLDRKFIEQHTSGFDEFASFVREFTPDKVAADTGLNVGQLYHFAEAIHRGKAVSFWWTMGVNQGHEATRTAQAIINLALMTGNIGRPGTGANSITGQCNAMGSRLFSNTTNLLGGHEFLDADDRHKVANILGLPAERIPSQNSWAYDQILQGVTDGKIKGLWIIGTNTAHSWIDQSSFHELRRKLDFLVVQDMFHSTDTARIADLVLPSAGWGEKEGTFINSERRIGLTRKVARAPGEALSDFNIFKLVAHYWGCADLFREWTSPQAVFQIIKRLSAGQPCDISGIRDYRHLEECGGLQWPLGERQNEECRMQKPEGAHDLEHSAFCILHSAFSERRLFSDGRFFTPDGKARFIFEAPRPLPEPVDEEYPFTLLTGRGTSVQWHTGTRTEKSDVLRQLRPAGIYVELNPHDARQLGLTADGAVRVTSRRGSLVAKAFVTPTIQPGQVFIPMHYLETNRLTLAAFDPNSRQPAYKACAVRLEKVRKATKRKVTAPLEGSVGAAGCAHERR
jgi:assimilatory nitrate reductase catalytic subunit